MSAQSTTAARPLRRLGAIAYDTLLILAMFIVATLVFLIGARGQAITSANWMLQLAYRLVLLGIVVGFFGFFWTRKGRTLGMQAWKLRIEREEGGLPSWRDALIRIVCAALPWAPAFVALVVATRSQAHEWTLASEALLVLGLLNYASAWLDTNRRALHERGLKTRIVSD